MKKVRLEIEEVENLFKCKYAYFSDFEVVDNIKEETGKTIVEIDDPDEPFYKGRAIISVHDSSSGKKEVFCIDNPTTRMTVSFFDIFLSSFNGETEHTFFDGLENDESKGSNYFNIITCK